MQGIIVSWNCERLCGKASAVLWLKGRGRCLSLWCESEHQECSPIKLWVLQAVCGCYSATSLLRFCAGVWVHMCLCFVLVSACSGAVHPICVNAVMSFDITVGLASCSAISLTNKCDSSQPLFWIFAKPQRFLRSPMPISCADDQQSIPLCCVPRSRHQRLCSEINLWKWFYAKSCVSGGVARFPRISSRNWCEAVLKWCAVWCDTWSEQRDMICEVSRAVRIPLQVSHARPGKLSCIKMRTLKK